MVTLRARDKGAHDIFCCSACGLEGKSYQLGVIQIDGRVKNPPVCKKASSSVKIKIRQCNAVGRPFGNALPGSVHSVIDSPEPDKYPNGMGGVWIMGVGEPIRLLFGEYEETN